METLRFQCWIYGEDVGRIFPVKILSTETVGDLKDAIKSKKPLDLRDVDPDHLALYKFTPSAPDLDDENLNSEFKQWSLQSATKLNSRTKLSNLKPDSTEWLIIVSVPGLGSRVTEPSTVVPDMTLNCWVRGDEISHIFPVEISSAKTVGALRDAIKSKKPVDFSDIDANHLALYQVSFPIGNLGKTLKGVTLDPSTQLDPLPPSRTYGKHTLEDVEDSFRDVKRAKVGNAAPSTIALPSQYRAIQQEPDKVSFVTDEGLEKKLNALFGHEAPLCPVSILSELFSDNPPQNHVHIVVEAPPSTRLRLNPPVSSPSLPLHSVAAQRLTFIKNSPIEAPSSAAKIEPFSNRQDQPEQTIYCNRPHAAEATIPPTLLHAAFGKFLDDCETYEITEEDNSLALELNARMSTFHSNELERANTVREVFSKWGLDFVVSHTPAGYVTDGDMPVKSHRFSIIEFKNEVGSTGAEPYNQAILYYLDSTIKSATAMGTSPLPCIIILVFGPYIAFAGAVWNLRPVVQTLSFVLPLHYHSTDTKMRTHVARHLGAFKKAAHTLEEYYRELIVAPLPSSPDHPQLFPYPKEFISLQDAQRHSFNYLSQLFKDKLLFDAITDDEIVCIKFVRRYSMEAHLACASLGCAPKLRGFEKIAGDWFMVVMDRVPSEGYCPLSKTTPTASLTSNIRNTLKQLHQSGHVHGDVRDTNILVSNDKTKFMFVDFDWAGKIGVVRYPMNVTRAWNLWRPIDAVDGALITAEHDMAMLKDIEKRYGLKN